MIIGQAGITKSRFDAQARRQTQANTAYHNPYESFPNTVVINPSKSSTELMMGASGSCIEPSGGEQVSQFEIDLTGTNHHDGSFGGIMLEEKSTT